MKFEDKLRGLLEKRVGVEQSAQAFLELEKMSTDQQADYANALASLKEVNGQIKQVEELAREIRSAPVVQKLEDVTENKTPQLPEKEIEEFEAKFSITKFLHEAAKGKLTGKELEMHEEACLEAQAMGGNIENFGIPGSFLGSRVTQASNTAAGSAGTGPELVPTFLTGFIDTLRARMVLAQAGAQFITGLTGDVAIPRKITDGAFTWVAENVTSAEAPITFDQAALTPNRLTGHLAYSNQLLVQGSQDIANLINQDFVMGAGLALDAAGLVGSGSGAVPEGVTNFTDINVATTGALDWASIVEMETLVAADNADFGQLAYISSPTQRGAAKSIFIDTGSGLTLVDRNEANGYPLLVTTQATAATWFFGNWNDLLIGQWGGLDILADPYSLKKLNQTEVVLHLLADVVGRHEKSFAKFVVS